MECLVAGMLCCKSVTQSAGTGHCHVPLELEVEGKLSANGYQTLIEYAYLSVAFIVDANNLNLLTAHVDLTTGKRGCRFHAPVAIHTINVTRDIPCAVDLDQMKAFVAVVQI